MDHMEQEMNNQSVLTRILADLIANSMIKNCDSIFQVDRSADTYEAVKMSPFLEELVPKNGTYSTLCKTLFFNAASSETNQSYDYFIRKGVTSERIFIRRIHVYGTESRTDMDFLYIPSAVGNMAVVILLPVYLYENSRTLAAVKNRALEDEYLYSMIVNLDKDECYEIHVSEVKHDEHDQVVIGYSEWQEHIAPTIIPEYRPMFLQNTDPSTIRKSLQKKTRYWFDLLMNNLKGECIWTRHILMKVRYSGDDALTFIYMVQDMDATKKDQLHQQSMQTVTASEDTTLSDKKKNQNAEPFQGSTLALAVLNHVEDEIRKYYMKPLTLNQLANKYYINSAYLGQLFIRRYGMPFHKYLTIQRMKAAARLLRETDDPILEVARASGISNTNYFNRLFREHFHCTPLEYRMNNSTSVKTPR